MAYTIEQPECRDARDEVLALWKRNLERATRQRYEWLYESGPAQEWIVRDESNTAVGSMGMMGRTMKVFDEIRPVGQPIDLNVDKQHRLGGPAMQLQRSLTEAVDNGHIVLAYGLPNAQAEPVLRRVGYKVLGTMGRWTRPLRVDNLLSRRLNNPFLRKATAGAINTGLWLSARETRCRRRKGVRSEVVDRFDERFDRLWLAARDKYAIIGERNSEYLQWRFAQCPDVRYRTLCLCDDRDRLLAYLTYSQSEGRSYVGDMLFADNRDLELLLAEFIWELRRHRNTAVTMIFYGDPFIANTLRKFGFYHRQSQWKVMIYPNRDELANAAASDDRDASFARATQKENWFITRADIDT
ncbi:MAG: GNAT family N-acetyltransferase [Pirellulales bacterium]|nr:GNAT family N-acetyltransferase [Pirellulales bacterium]